MSDLIEETKRALRDPQAYLSDFTLSPRSAEAFRSLVQRLLDSLETKEV